MTEFVTQLKTQQIAVKRDVPLSSFTSFHIGGPAKYFAVVEDEKNLVLLLKLAREHEIPVFIMGGGSNVLVADEGFDGLVVHCQLHQIKFDDCVVHVDSGVMTAQLAGKTVVQGLAGLEWSVGIPGRIGGAIRGNAGAMGGEFRDVITSVRYIDDHGDIHERSNEACEFGYRESIFKKTKDIILGCTIQLSRGDKNESQKKMRDYLSHRNTTQPKGFGSSGCMFKNYECGDDEEIERLRGLGVPDGMLESKRISAGWLVEHAGAKGVKVGGAEVSDVHGNFVVNAGDATAENVRDVVNQVKQKVKDVFGLDLHEEVQYIGFEA